MLDVLSEAIHHGHFYAAQDDFRCITNEPLCF